jgi:hypothetical protein
LSRATNLRLEKEPSQTEPTNHRLPWKITKKAQEKERKKKTERERAIFGFSLNRHRSGFIEKKNQEKALERFRRSGTRSGLYNLKLQFYPQSDLSTSIILVT